MPLATYIPICDALARLMDPLVEVVIHDIKSDRICYKAGNLSVRVVGDSSLLDREELKSDLDAIVYPKRGFDGRVIKSISVKLENKWLMCMNVDISIFSQMNKLCQQMLVMDAAAKPSALFHKDWQERLHQGIHEFLQERNWQFRTLNLRQKKEIIKHLFDHGAFVEKNAADYIARALSIGRATVFNYLREWRGK